MKTFPGAIALITVIMIGAMLLVAGVSISLVGQTGISITGQADIEEHARSLANACAEEALHRLKLDTAYAGGTVPIAAGTCTASISGSGSSRTVTASATSLEFTKTVVVSVTLRQNAALTAGVWHIDAWTEADPP